MLLTFPSNVRPCRFGRRLLVRFTVCKLSLSLVNRGHLEAVLFYHEILIIPASSLGARMSWNKNINGKTLNTKTYFKGMHKPFRNVVNVILRHIQNHKARQSFQICLILQNDFTSVHSFVFKYCTNNDIPHLVCQVCCLWYWVQPGFLRAESNVLGFPQFCCGPGSDSPAYITKGEYENDDESKVKSVKCLDMTQC